MATTGKSYGLILPSKKTAAHAKVAKPSVFGDSSSDEEDASAARRHINVSLSRENEKRSKQTHEAVAKALEEDPSIFEYDSLYDDMTDRKKRADPRLQKKDTKPKYIHVLKKTAERRKLEQDIVYERKAQREIEQEGRRYADKETFLTSAYQKKLEERKQLEEDLRREEKIEEANAVTKQKDLSRFYKHILHQQTSGTEKKSVPSSPPATREENRRRGEDTHRREERSREAGERETEEEDSGRNRAERSPEAEAERKRDSVSPERLESPDKEPDSDGKDPAPASGSPAEQQETKPVDPAERRKAASAKRTGDQALQSARERYLTRKRARLSSGD